MSNKRPAVRQEPTPVGRGSSSASHVLHLLRILGEHGVLRVADAADVLGVARSTAHRLLTTLIEHGFAQQDKPNGPYRPGPRLTDLGRAALDRLDLRGAARPALERLRAYTQETVSLSLLEASTTRFIDCLEGHRTVRVGSRTGIVLPAHCTAAGKAMLAELSPVELGRRYPYDQLTARTTTSVTTEIRLEEELHQIRQAGYALNAAEAEDDICAVAAAVPKLTTLPLAAIAVVIPTQRMPDAEAGHALAPAVLDAARSISSVNFSGLA